MHALRHFKLITRLVLVWWLLAMGAAVASPLLKSPHSTVICSGGIMKVLVLNDDGSTSTQPEVAMHCPLCLALAAPPSVLSMVVPRSFAWTYVVPYSDSTHVAARTASPLPARGPPSP